MAEKDDLYPMGRDAARNASRQMADEEFWVDLVNQLEPDLRFGGRYGLISALGLGKGADRAKVAPYQMRNQARADRAGDADDLLRSQLLGYYMPSSATDAGSPKGFDRVHEFLPGSEEPTPGGSIAAFYPMSGGSKSDMYRRGRLPLGKDDTSGSGFPSTVQHELFHRGMDSPAMQAFISETGIKPPYADHSVLTAIQPNPRNERNAEMIRGRQENFESKFRDWLNAGNAEKFGAYVPTPSAEVKEDGVLEKIIRILGLGT
jgi:hypothetical protein